MECPVCEQEATLYAEVNPNGLIGCFCGNCKKGYTTKNPEQGWREHFKIRYCEKVAQDLKVIHNVNIDEELLRVMETEFSNMVLLGSMLQEKLVRNLL